MKVDIETMSKKAAPVLYVHQGKEERIVATLVDDTWLSNVYDCALRAGFEDPYCTAYGRDSGFMPHNHVVFDDEGNIVE